MNYKYTSRSAEQTIELAQNFESEKFPNMVICLDGELGSGKTVFVKGFASSLGIEENITSPTFTIIKEYYDGEMPLFHVDAYKVDENKDSFGLTDCFSKDGVTIIEWSELVSELLPEERLEIKIRIIDENTRVFILHPIGQQYEELCESVL
ncbi:MAG: tRNA (adenosine(37)-N6)-threonylcarbamoyltransferase complex ATPase subunit type 1 TsaE [Bacilli bacterium]|nr:tRNA (adenosine(37)-N6)-threonylcarbamoyltransferase complex ATPase subunit type 1 TsaE [Bacilli bacterium]